MLLVLLATAFPASVMLPQAYCAGYNGAEELTGLEAAFSPVMLLSFFGDPAGDDNLVTWKFDQLTGLVDVSLQRSTDNTSFATIAYWTSDDNEAKINFIDKQPPAVSYYRILYTTTGAVANISDTIKITHKIVPGWLVRPNPARGRISLYWRNISPGNYSLSLRNVSGMLLSRKTFAISAPTASLQLPVESFSGGLVMLVVYQAGGMPVFTGKVMLLP